MNQKYDNYQENEFLASFSQDINVDYEYKSCTCSSSCIRNEITNLKNQVDRMEEKLDAILQKIDSNIIKNCDKMGDHIDFVNNVYDTVKVPLHYISNKVQKMIGGNTDHHHTRTTCVANKIDYSNDVNEVNDVTDVNDDEYLFTENN